MSCYKSNLEYLNELRKNISSQRELLDFQEKHLEFLEDKIGSFDKSKKSYERISESCESTVVRIGDFAEMLKSRGVPFGRNKIHSWLTNRGYTYRENDRNYAKSEYVEKGLFEVRNYVVNKRSGATVEQTIYLTPKGVAYFMKKILREFNLEEIE